MAEMEAMHQEDLQRGEELSRQLTLAHREKAHILEQVSWGGGSCCMTHVRTFFSHLVSFGSERPAIEYYYYRQLCVAQVKFRC